MQASQTQAKANEEFESTQSNEDEQPSSQTELQKFVDSYIVQLPQNNAFLLEPPIQINKKSYSLEADMVTGWRPRKNLKINMNNVFPINFSHELIDELTKQLIRQKAKTKYALVYLGPRPVNSYMLHQDRAYANPYPLHRKVDIKSAERWAVPTYFKPAECKLQFDSKFQSGNLDLAVDVGNSEYDLFMRIDSNTKGHTNWYYFEVKNHDFIGTARFNICNFRRERSLYQRGLRPFAKSVKADGQWKQVGKNIKYERKRFRYSFLYEDEDEQQLRFQG